MIVIFFNYRSSYHRVNYWKLEDLKSTRQGGISLKIYHTLAIPCISRLLARQSKWLILCFVHASVIDTYRCMPSFIWIYWLIIDIIVSLIFPDTHIFQILMILDIIEAQRIPTRFITEYAISRLVITDLRLASPHCATSPTRHFLAMSLSTYYAPHSWLISHVEVVKIQTRITYCYLLRYY